MQLRSAIVDLSKLVGVLFELLLRLANLGELINGVLEFGKEITELFLGLLNQVSENLSDGLLTLIDKLCLHVRGVENDELFVSCARPVLSDILDDFFECLDTVLVFSDCIVSTSLRLLKESHLSSVGPQT